MSERTPVPLWERDFPYEATAEEAVTRRKFARYLVAGAGVTAAGNLGLAAWTQLRAINSGDPRAIVELGEVAVGDTFLFDTPATTTRRSCCGDQAVGVQPEVHPPRLRRLLRIRPGPLALPLPRGQLREHRGRHIRAATEIARPDRGGDPRRHHLGAGVPPLRSSQHAPRASSAVVIYVIILVAFQVFLLTVAVEALATDDEPLAWATAAVSITLAGGSALLLRYLRP